MIYHFPRQIYLNQHSRESRFTSRCSQCLPMNPLPKIKRTTINPSPHRRWKTNTDMNNRQPSVEAFKRDEIERLTADVQAILVCNTLTLFTAV